MSASGHARTSTSKDNIRALHQRKDLWYNPYLNFQKKTHTGTGFEAPLEIQVDFAAQLRKPVGAGKEELRKNGSRSRSPLRDP